MFKPTSASGSSTSIVQTLSSLLQRVQLFGPDDNSSPSLDSSVMSQFDPHYRNPTQSAISSISSKPIPYRVGHLKKMNNYNEGSLESINFNASLDNSLYSQDFNSNAGESFSSSFRETDFTTKSDDEEENTLEECDDNDEINKSNTAKIGLSLEEISLCEVAQHDMFHDCWIVFYDKVYDVTSFLYEHPGGEELLMEHAGRDGTMAFRSVGHSKMALKSLNDYIVGILPPHERIFNDWEIN